MDIVLASEQNTFRNLRIHAIVEDPHTTEVLENCRAWGIPQNIIFFSHRNSTIQEWPIFLFFAQAAAA